MAVYFSAQQHPVGWTFSCPFSSEVFNTWQSAEASRACHPHGGCDESIAWTNANDLLPDKQAGANSRLFVEEHDQWPEECQDSVFTVPVFAEKSPEVQMSFWNADDILRALGLVETTKTSSLDPPEVLWCGTIDANDLSGRALVALALVDDPGRLPSSERHENGATVVDCGRDPGYSNLRLEQILNLASWAKERNLKVSWS